MNPENCRAFLLSVGVALAVVVATRSVAQADLIGDTITASSNSLYVSSTATVGPGAEFVARVSTFMPDGFSIDFGANDMVITAVPRDFALSNYFARLAFTNTSNPFESISFIDSSLAGFNQGNVSLAEGILTVSIPDNISFKAGGSARYAIPALPIPEPPSLVLLGLAMLAVAGGARHRSRCRAHAMETHVREWTLWRKPSFARRFASLLCAVAILVVATRADAGTLYAATGSTHGELYILDPNTGGVLRDVGPLNDAAGRNYPLEAIAFQPHTRVLYGATHYSDTADPATVSKLVTVNPETAEVTVVGSFFLGNPGTMTDIAFPLTGGLSGISSYGPPQIHHIDLATGITTPSGLIGNLPATVGGGIATMGAGAILGGIADPMYFVTPTANELGRHGFACQRGGCLYLYLTIANPAKPAGGGFYSALDFDGDVLYGLNVGPDSPPQTHLVRINTSTGAVTDIGRSVDGLAAIAFVPSKNTSVFSPPGSQFRRLRPSSTTFGH
jgi:hypothetical protein